MNRKNLVAYFLMMMLVSCRQHSSKTEDEIEDEIRLSDGESVQSFVLPVGFNAGHPVESLLRFSVQYPSMTPLNWTQAIKDNEISVYIQFSRGSGKAEFLIQHAADKIDTTLPGQFYHDGKQGAFEIYRGMLNKATLAPESMVYVFRDDEGQLVAAEDPGSWSYAYIVHRKMGPKIQVRYLVAKPLGRNFIEIDKAVKDFILTIKKS